MISLLDTGDVMDKNKRFYDRNPDLSSAVETLMCFPPEFQSVLAEGIALVAEKECKANELLQQFKSLGTQKVLALYKSKNKARSYDDNPNVHKVMNYLMVLSEENRQFMAKNILGLFSHVQEYLQTCKTYEQESSLEGVQNVSNTYANQGDKATRQLLSGMKQDFIQKLEQRETISGGGGDMKVTGEWN
ncbi:MAG: hypothetical protein KTR14_08870 [Vampirovibrio sp.]|nr:hypothetical protein [Vampirovibrio sp.]